MSGAAAEAPFDALEAAERGMDAESVTRRTSGRRGGNRRKEERQAALQRFKRGREAVLGEREDDVYDEVSEETWQALQRERQEAADFIVDDGSGMYNDYGQEIFDEDDDEFLGDSNALKKTRVRRTGTTKRRQPKAAAKKRVNSMFTGGGKARKSRLGAAVVKPAGPDGEVSGSTDSFLESVLQEAGVEAPAEEGDNTTRKRKKKKASNSRNLALLGSTSEIKDAFYNQTTTKDDDASSPNWIRASAAGSPAARKKRRADNSQSRSLDSIDGDERDYADDNDGVEYQPVDISMQVDDVPPAGTSDAATPALQPAPARKVTVLSVPVDDDDDEDGERTSYLKAAAPVSDSSDWRAVREQATALTDSPPDLSKPAATRNPAAVKVTKFPVIEPDEDYIKMISSTAFGTIRDEAKKERKLKALEGEPFMRMYWLDAFEGEGALSGSIFLFGKVWAAEAKAWVSACVRVQHVERNLFVLPRKYEVDEHGTETDKEVSFEALYTELLPKLQRRGIKKFLCKPVERSYCFEDGEVPQGTQSYFKIKYDAAYPRIDESVQSGRTFKKVLGGTIGPLERFLMKRKMMGPSWLDIRGVKAAESHANYSWCKVEGEIESYKQITNLGPDFRDEEGTPYAAAPPLTVLSLSMQTVLNRKTHSNEIVMVSGLVHDEVLMDHSTDDPEKKYSHFNAIRKLGDNPFPFDFKLRLQQTKGKNLSVMGSERALLSFLIAKIHRIDPDVIVGHNLLGFDLDVLLHRMKASKTAYWSRLGRLKRTNFPKLTGGHGGRASYVERTICSGRLLCDVKVSAREFIRQVSYGLSDLVREQLGLKRRDVDQNLVGSMFGDTDQLLRLTDHIERDAYLVMSLFFHFKVLPLSKQITNITGGLLARTFCSGRSERNEYLLCHVFHNRKYLVPEKLYGKALKKANTGVDEDEDAEASKKKSKRRKPAYAGGLVLEPKKGFYDQYVLLLDFNSLYPSIIQEYNICFTTVDRSNIEMQDGEMIKLPDVPDEELEEGILPKVLKTLIEKRKVVKGLIKDEKRREKPSARKLAEYDIRQKALKLTANSMYGCLGFGMSRFYAKPLAALITSKGREILQKTVDLAEEKVNLNVIYGDTDSIMINTRSTDLKEVKELGEKVKKEVNQLYKKLEIEIDGVYKTMLLLKKKKYAALAIVERNGEIHTVRETKGLDMVRRDWCGLSHDVGYYILNQILSQTTREELVEKCHDYLRQVGEDVKGGGKVPLEKFVIHKGLTKKPEDYPDAKAQPHVIVALKMKKSGKAVRPLDTIPYAICLDGTDKSATQRAYHPDEIRKDKLEIDTTYYLKNQIHPVVNRLLQPIEGTDSMQVAACLGLDPTGFKTQVHREDENDDRFALRTLLSDEDRYRNAAKLRIKCTSCGEETDFPGVFRRGSDLRCGLLCPNPSCRAKFSVGHLCNAVALRARDKISAYYRKSVVCDESSCPRGSNATRQLSVNGKECVQPRCSGSFYEVYTAQQLDTQLHYYRNLFDVPHALEQLDEELKTSGESVLAGHKETFARVYQFISVKYLERSQYQKVDLQPCSTASLSDVGAEACSAPVASVCAFGHSATARTDEFPSELVWCWSLQARWLS